MDERLFLKLSTITSQRLVAMFDKSPSHLWLKRLATYKGAIVELIVHDPRKISAEQRKKAYALMGDIDQNYVFNDDVELTKQQLKAAYSYEYPNEPKFSLSNCSMDTARKFIEFLIEFSIQNGVQLTNSIDLIRGSYALEYNAVKYHKCVICGLHADIAHVESVGSGVNRNKINHIGKRVMGLCREHHIEQHKKGIDTFMRENYLKGVLIDEDVNRMLKLGHWQIDEDNEDDT